LKNQIPVPLAIMTTLRCPTCKKEFSPEESTAMPFCSERCRLIDLGRWLDEENRLPIDPEEAEDAESHSGASDL